MALDPIGSTTPPTVPTTSTDPEPAEETPSSEESGGSSESADTVELSGDEPAEETAPEATSVESDPESQESSSTSTGSASSAAEAHEARKRRAEAQEAKAARAEAQTSKSETKSAKREHSFYLESTSDPEAENPQSLADNLPDLGLFSQSEAKPFAALFGPGSSEAGDRFSNAFGLRKPGQLGLDLYGPKADRKKPAGLVPFSFSIKA